MERLEQLITWLRDYIVDLHKLHITDEVQGEAGKSGGAQGDQEEKHRHPDRGGRTRSKEEVSLTEFFSSADYTDFGAIAITSDMA